MPANTNTESMEMSQQPTMAAQPQMTTEQPVSTYQTSRQASGRPVPGLLVDLGNQITPWHNSDPADCPLNHSSLT